MVGVGGEAGVGTERCTVIDTGEVATRGEGHVRFSAGSQGTAVVLCHGGVVGQLVGHRETAGGLGTEVLDPDRHRLVVGEAVVLRHGSRDGDHTHVVLRHRGVDGDGALRRLAGVVHLEHRVDAEACRRTEADGTGQRCVLRLRIDFLGIIGHRRVGELRRRVDTVVRHTARVAAVVLRIEQQAFAVEVVAAFDSESDPTDFVESELTVEHQSGIGGLRRPVDGLGAGSDVRDIRGVLQPELHRDGNAVGLSRADMEVDAVDTSPRATHILLVVEDLGIGVTVSERERCIARLGGVVTRTGNDVCTESVRLDTAAIVIGCRTVNRVGGEAVAFRNGLVVGGVLVEVEVVQRRSARGHRLRTAVRHREGKSLRRGRQGGDVHRARNGVVSSIDR